MAHLRVTHSTTASPAACWALMSNFVNIDFFNPNLKSSHLLAGSPEHGVGMTRQCDLIDGKNYIREKVIDWQEGRSYTVDIYDGTMPVRKSKTTLGLSPRADGGTDLYMDFTYTPKYGPLGAVMNVLAMRSMFRALLKKVLTGLSEKAIASERSFKAAA